MSGEKVYGNKPFGQWNSTLLEYGPLSKAELSVAMRAFIYLSRGDVIVHMNIAARRALRL
jgi:hypothetical protein